MRKITLSILVLLLTMVQGVWAQSGLTTPLTLKATSDGTIVVNAPKTGMKYKLNNGAKTTMNVTTTIDVNENDVVEFYGNGTSIPNYEGTNISGGTATCIVYGNIMSLVNENGFATATTMTATYAFSKLFQKNTTLTDASDLLLPTTTQTGCYFYMFDGCTSLTTAPALPAMTAAERCYYYMFIGCTSLTTAPALPAMTVGTYSYSHMFDGCTSLTTAPALPATTLEECCYHQMFYNCTNLTTAPAELPATTLDTYCYSQMFMGCTSLTTAPVLPATTLVDNCYRLMFYGCTKLNSVTCLATNISANDCVYNWLKGVAATGTFYKAPKMIGWGSGSSGIPSGWDVENYVVTTPLTLKATSAGTIVVTTPQTGMQYKLNNGAKTTMNVTTTIDVNENDEVEFYGNGTSITKYGDYPITMIAGGTATCIVYGNIMSLVDENGFATATTLTGDCNFRRLFEDNTALTDASDLLLPATTLTESCCFQMFNGCTNLITAPAELPATTTKELCCYRMFDGCTKLTTAPALPAMTAAERCYYYMFNGCTSLTTAPALPATTVGIYSYSHMFDGCTNLTTAPAELPATTLASTCYFYMFKNCKKLTTAPVLPAKTLTTSCYEGMFLGCEKLNYVKCLATNKSASKCTNNWLEGVAATGTFTKNANTTWSSGIPSSWTVVNYADEATDNSTWLTNDNTKTENVILKRTLQTGGWNTFAVPFDINPVPTGWTVKKLTNASTNGSTLTLTFGDAASIEAGKPYLVKVTAVVENPTFNGVTISNSTTPTEITSVVSFVPVLAPTAMTAGDKTKLFVTGGNKLTRPSANGNINGFRAYFQLLDANARSFVLDLGDGETTSLTPVPSPRGEGSEYYSLDGRKLQGKPTTKGLYIVNGKKIVIK